MPHTGSQPYNCHTMTHWTPVGVPLLKHRIKNDSIHVSLSFPLGRINVTESVFVPDMILGVWISTKPFLMRVSLKSWHTPDCRRKMAWLVVVFEREHTQAKRTATHKKALPHLA